jgi:hypothetical protein
VSRSVANGLPIRSPPLDEGAQATVHTIKKKPPRAQGPSPRVGGDSEALARWREGGGE